MSQERVARREVREEIEADTTTTPAQESQVVEEHVVEETAETAVTRRPRPRVTNVNVNEDPVSGNVNVNTPDGTQVNINT